MGDSYSIIQGREKRKNFLLSLWIFLGIALVNQFFFDPKVGSLYANLLFDGQIQVDFWHIAFNIIVCIAVSILFLYIFVKRPKLMSRIAAIIAVALIGLGSYNVKIIEVNVDAAKTGEKLEGSSTKALNLSRTGKNVVVIMLDRAIGTYVPYIFDEKPELKQTYEGFVYYPNTVSFGMQTKYGSPGLFGGYEYNPLEFNKRSDEKNVDKHNEALSVMPVLFWQEGYKVTVCDAPFGNYVWDSDMSFYDKYPGIETEYLIGQFSAQMDEQMNNSTDIQERNFIMYSLFRTVPLPLKSAVYDRGYYISLRSNTITSSEFIDNYSELEALKDITNASDEDENVFIMMQNATPHNPTFLNPPDYSVYDDVINMEYKYADREYEGRMLRIRSDSEWGHYCANMISYQAISDWIESLKNLGVYDNTRIILVADHGYLLEQFEDLIHADGLDVEAVNPLLMVKDFNSRTPFTIDNTFMTNADVPSIATEGLVKKSINPFTGVSLDGTEIKENGVLVTDKRSFPSLTKTETTFDLSGAHWWTVHDNIFDLDNWEKLNAEEVDQR